MIYVYLYGRLGNNLSQIAAAATLAKRNRTDFAAFPVNTYWCPEPDNCYLNDYLKTYKDTILRKVNFVDELPHSVREIGEFENLSLLKLKKDEDVILNGYYLNKKYIEAKIIHELYEIDNDTFKYIKQKYSFLFKENFTSIVVRRGDYLKIPHYFSICSASYYKKAIKEIEDRGFTGKYLIISDDIEWCKKKLKSDNFYFVDEEAPIIDLYLQSFCENNILSNSTFACWGALLNNNPNKIVVIPNPWFGIAYRNKDIDLFDSLPQEWIKVVNFFLYYEIIAKWNCIKLIIKKRISKWMKK